VRLELAAVGPDQALEGAFVSPVRGGEKLALTARGRLVDPEGMDQSLTEIRHDLQISRSADGFGIGLGSHHST